MPDPRKKDPTLPRGVTIEDQWEKRRRLGKPVNPGVRRYLAKALIGGTKYKSKVFDKRRDAIDWATATVARIQAGLDTGRCCLVVTYLDEYLSELKSRRLSEGYIRQAEDTLQLLHNNGAKDLNNPSFIHTAKLILYNKKALKTNRDGSVRRQTQLKLSPSTINRYIAQAKTFSTWCSDNGYANRDVLAPLKKLREVKKNKPVLTVSELKRLLNDENSHHSFWLMTCLMCYLGLRCGEAAGLRTADILFEEEIVRVCMPDGHGMKLKWQKERLVPLQPELAEILRKQMDPKAKYVVKSDRPRKDKTKWRTDFDQLLRLAGITKRPGLSPHSCRHTYISLMVAHTGDMRKVQKSVGHQSIVTTEKYAESADAYYIFVKDWPKDQYLHLRNL